MTRRGWAFVLPTWEQRTPATGSSSSPGLLPTPTTTPYGNNQSASAGATVRPSLDRLFATPTVSIAQGGRPQDSKGKRDLRLDLLPTPRASDGEKGGPSQRGSSGDRMLPSAVTHLLPTPEAKLSHSGPDYARMNREASGGDDLTTALWRLLPTPTASDAKGPNALDRRPPTDDDLPTRVLRLLPTPTAMDSRSSGKGQSGTHGTTLTDAARECTGATTSPPSGGGK